MTLPSFTATIAAGAILGFSIGVTARLHQDQLETPQKAQEVEAQAAFPDYSRADRIRHEHDALYQQGKQLPSMFRPAATPVPAGREGGVPWTQPITRTFTI